MGSDKVVDVVRKYGTEEAIKASLTTQRGGVEGSAARQHAMLARLVRILENKFGLRRGHVVSMICAAEGIPEDRHATE